MTKNELKIENFNLKVPVGGKVILTKDDKTEIETVTTSVAYLLGGHTPVVFVAGISGCYFLDRVRPA